MFAGFIGLALNPSFWVALALTATVSFSGGVFKGWADSKADQYRVEVVALREAAAQKDAIIKADAVRMSADEAERLRLKDQLERVLNETDQAAACKLSSGDLERLRALAAGKS